jgi:hypothetical protein
VFPVGIEDAESVPVTDRWPSGWTFAPVHPSRPDLFELSNGGAGAVLTIAVQPSLASQLRGRIEESARLTAWFLEANGLGPRRLIDEGARS